MRPAMTLLMKEDMRYCCFLMLMVILLDEKMKEREEEGLTLDDE